MLLVLSFSKAFGTKKSSSANSQTSASQESNKTYVSRNLFVGPVCRRVCGLLFTPAGCFFDRVFHIRHVPTPVQSWSVKPTTAFCRLKYV